jgi:LCP family protein required for cell wall assembly
VTERDPYGETPLERTRIMPVTPGTPPPSARPPSARPASARQPPSARRVRRRSTGRRFLRVVGWLLVLLLVFLVALGLLAWARIDKVDAIPEDHGSAVSAGKVYLLVGSDSREGLTPEEQEDLATGADEGRRTDTIMLLHLPRSGRPALVSVPRDSLVEIPGVGEERINAAYAFGGAPLLVETLEQETGVAIDDYVEIGFRGFASIVDAVGGVEVCVAEAIADERAGIDLAAGCQTLDGPDALGYARTRYFDPRGDLGRVERQREVVGAIADEALSPSTMLNPVTATRLALSGGAALTVDEGTGPIDLARFAWGLGRVSSGSGDTLTVPLGEVADTVRWDEEAAGELWSALQEGREVPDSMLELRD